LNSYTFHITLYDAAFFGLLFIGLTFILQLWFAKSVNRAANRFLALALVVMMLWMVRILAIDVRLETYLPGWDRVPMQFLLALGPLIYFYVLKITHPRYQFRWKDLLHFSPILLEQSVLALEISESAATGTATYSTPVFLLLNPALQLLIFISIITYLYRSHKLIQRFYRRVQPVMMDRSLLEFRWLDRLLAATALLWIIWIGFTTVDYFGYHNELGIHVYYPFYIFFAVIIIWTAAAAFLKPQAGTIVQSPAAPRQSPPVELRAKGAWLKKIVETNCYYRDPELSLGILAEKLGLTIHELSRIINSVLKKSFNDFINEYRVRDVASKINNPAYNHITLLGIAYESGFNSKATFNRTFKQMTGKSPVEYKAHLAKEVSSYNLRRTPQSAAVISDHETTLKWSEEKLNRNYMFRNYFKIAFRRLQKNKIYTTVNIIGLTVGIASCLLIGLFVVNELSYDHFQKKADRIVRMVMQYGEGGKQVVAVTGTKVGPQLKRTFPQVQGFVRLINGTAIVKSGETIYDEKRFLYADSSFFSMFSFPLLRGDAKTVLDAPNKLVLSESSAKKYFGNTDPVGKTLRINDAKDFLVTGIVADAPENSQIKYDFIASFSTLDASKTEEWFTANYITFLLLKNANQLNGFRSQLNSYMRGVSKDELHLEASSPLQYILEPMLDVHLKSAYDGLEPNGSMTTVYILGIIALLILAIACINYTNLATVQSGSRSIEIGIRKVLGAQKKQLFNQFISESFLVTFLSLIAGIVLALLLLPYFDHLTGKQLSFAVLLQPLPIIILLLLCGSIALASGSYPAFVLSDTRLISILKSGVRMTSSGGVFRQSLIVFQFVVSGFLIISTIIILQQLRYIQNKKLGYDKEHVIVLPISRQMRDHQYEAVKTEISRMPNVISVSGANATPTFVQWGDGLTADNGHGKVNLDITALPCDLDFIKTMNMQLIAGSDFTRADLALADTTNQLKNFRYAFILNETAVKALGWTPEQAIGKTVNKNAPGVIKGVVKDFYFSSLHHPVGPLMLFLDRLYTNYYFVKVTGKNIPSTIDNLQKLWKERDPSRPFEYRFLDDDYNSLYVTEQKTSAVFSTFSTLAILLACMGLFALSAFATAQRTKEIGIRKVLGAGVSSIVVLIAKDFLRLTLIAIVIAAPVAWYFMHRWLQDFAYHVNIQWWVFILAAVICVLIAFVTVSLQSVKAALANPVKSLRSE
jgi:ABC-type antimicrobial peptide transport system permease subunit/AraC-like DNA-binding protein